MVTYYQQALKKYNENSSEWCTPRRGTKEYDEVKKIEAKLRQKEQQPKKTKKKVAKVRKEELDKKQLDAIAKLVKKQKSKPKEESEPDPTTMNSIEIRKYYGQKAKEANDDELKKKLEKLNKEISSLSEDDFIKKDKLQSVLYEFVDEYRLRNGQDSISLVQNDPDKVISFKEVATHNKKEITEADMAKLDKLDKLYNQSLRLLEDINKIKKPKKMRKTYTDKETGEVIETEEYTLAGEKYLDQYEKANKKAQKSKKKFQDEYLKLFPDSDLIEISRVNGILIENPNLSLKQAVIHYRNKEKEGPQEIKGSGYMIQKRFIPKIHRLNLKGSGVINDYGMSQPQRGVRPSSSSGSGCMCDILSDSSDYYDY